MSCRIWSSMSLGGMMMALSFITACGQQDGVEGSGGEAPAAGSIDTVDQAELRTAEANQAALERAGFVFEGRVWLARSTHVSFFHDQAGGTLRFPVTRGTAQGAAVLNAHVPAASDTLADYVRSFGAEARDVPGRLDTLVFAPVSPAEAATDSVTSALSNQACDINTFNAVCARPLRWHAKSYLDFTSIDNTAVQWSQFDQSGDTVHGGISITNWDAAVCADNGPATLFLNSTDQNVTLVVNHGTFGELWREYGYYEHDRCLGRFLGFCDAWAADNVFRGVPSVTITTRVGDPSLPIVFPDWNYHTCGRMGGMPPVTYRLGTGACQRNECPRADWNQAL